MHTTKADITRSLYNLPFGIASLVTLLTVILGAGFQMLFYFRTNQKTFRYGETYK